MSKGKYHDVGKTRRVITERRQKRELFDANRGIVEEELIDEAFPMRREDSPASDWIPYDKRKWYVIDTNLILSCVDVIYDADDENWRPPLDFRPSLDSAHIIIPSVVFEELNHLKDGHTHNRTIARKAFRRLMKFFPNSERSLREIMELSRPIPTGWKQQTISILPLHRDFARSLPWVPQPTDNDGWIAVTALAATMIRERLPVDGTASVDEVLEHNNSRRDVVLLTNDNPLLIKADEFGVRAKSYSFKTRPVFTGMRDLVVPAALFEQFWQEDGLSKSDFEAAMPNEPPLVANEYIVMTPEGDVYPKGYFAADLPFSNVMRYHKEKQMFYPLRFMKREQLTPPNAGIATYYDAMNDDSVSVIVATGKAGTGKTYQIVRHAIRVLGAGKYTRAVLIVNPDNGVGYLPGSQEKKLEPMIAFCKDAIRSYLAETPEFKRKREALRKFGDTNDEPSETRTDRKPNKYRELVDELTDGRIEKRRCRVEKVEKAEKTARSGRKTYAELLDEQVDYYYERYFTAIPYKQAQGRTFEDTIIIIDEAQRIIIDEMETFITRLGKNSLLVVCGDVNQIKYNSPEKRIKNGLIFTRMMYYDWEGCVNIHLTENMRHQAADIANRNYERVLEEIGELQT